MFATRSLRMFRPTARMMRPVPKEEQAAHTVSQRLRRLRQIPPELIPLGVVVAFAVCAAVYSSGRHLVVDKTIRLKRQNRAADSHHSEEEHH
ncbi:NADH dehydrogenase [ubiquinone] 1 alpha subcomplex subunit 4 [Madurella mycetomatis]|uniref:NADH dehydrogenase [ubiquinone] 1 alpha subcomplex subunit 4 n=1 Tax=Madurella mycetomatis TaxID=100816 RepID=A0A175W338_9PEZI|nr:NADH dehydrogenase [ubiquinone] 1 alpha subcomplex subunit 4 [Madurella mycetomatis]